MGKANIKAYHELCGIADRLKLPRLFKKDFYTFDRRVLMAQNILTGARKSESAPQVFAFVMRDTGTELYDCRRQDITREYLAHIYSAQVFDPAKAHFFFCTGAGNSVLEVEREVMLDLFAAWQAILKDNGLAFPPAPERT